MLGHACLFVARDRQVRRLGLEDADEGDAEANEERAHEPEEERHVAQHLLDDHDQDSHLAICSKRVQPPYEHGHGREPEHELRLDEHLESCRCVEQSAIVRGAARAQPTLAGAAQIDTGHRGQPFRTRGTIVFGSIVRAVLAAPARHGEVDEGEPAIVEQREGIEDDREGDALEPRRERAVPAVEADRG